FCILPPHNMNTAPPAAMMAPAKPTTGAKVPYSEADANISEPRKIGMVSRWDRENSMILCSPQQHRTVSGEYVATRKQITTDRRAGATKEHPPDEIGWRHVNSQSRGQTRNLHLKSTARANGWRWGRSIAACPSASWWSLGTARQLAASPLYPFSPPADA